MIVNDILPFLSQDDVNKIKQEILAILTEEKNKLDKYLRTFERVSIDESLELDTNLEYSSLEEFETIVRMKFFPIFHKMKNMLDKSEELKIKQEINKTIDDIKKKTNDEIISRYLTEIKETTEKLKQLIVLTPKQKEYEARLKDINLDKIDYTKSIIQILDELKNILISLYKLEMEIKQEKAKSDLAEEAVVRIKF